MYLPAHFEEKRPEILRELIATHPLGGLVTLGSGGLTANHLPFEFEPGASGNGILRAHVARANPVWRDHDAMLEALVIFQGPQAYISPTWYATKEETHQVVPTYNYCVVHAHGFIRVLDNPEWVRAQVERLTRLFEGRQEKPWAVADAPADFIERQVQAIVGLEITITRIEGKWKASQNRKNEDRARVAEALGADPMAGPVRESLARSTQA